jgi:hypothetical protein
MTPLSSNSATNILLLIQLLRIEITHSITPLPSQKFEPVSSVKMSIPTSTSVQESAVIEAHFSDVWHLVKLPEFSKWWSKLEKSEWVKGASEETDIVKWTFKDGTELQVKQEEHSVSFSSVFT